MEHTNIERETVILYNQAEKEARVCTEDQVMIRKLTSILSENRKDITLCEERSGYMEVLVPKRWVKVVPTRQLSDEKRQELSERMKAMVKAKKEVTE